MRLPTVQLIGDQVGNYFVQFYAGDIINDRLLAFYKLQMTSQRSNDHRGYLTLRGQIFVGDLLLNLAIRTIYRG